MRSGQGLWGGAGRWLQKSKYLIKKCVLFLPVSFCYHEITGEKHPKILRKEKRKWHFQTLLTGAHRVHPVVRHAEQATSLRKHPQHAVRHAEQAISLRKHQQLAVRLAEQATSLKKHQQRAVQLAEQAINKLLYLTCQNFAFCVTVKIKKCPWRILGAPEKARDYGVAFLAQAPSASGGRYNEGACWRSGQKIKPSFSMVQIFWVPQVERRGRRPSRFSCVFKENTRHLLRPQGRGR